MSDTITVRGTSTGEDIFSFTNADNEIVIANIGDFGSADSNEQLVATLVESWEPDALTTTGDNSYNGPDYDADVDPYYGDMVLRGMVYPCPGNHDWDDDLDAYFAYFEDTVGDRYYYKKTLGAVSLFMLDGNANTPDGILSSEVQSAWLTDELSNSSSPWNVVMVHQPPYSSGTVHGSTANLQWGFSGADLVLSGHEHNYERLLVGGMQYIINGLGGKSKYAFGTPLSGSQYRYNTLYGAGKMTVTPKRLQWEFYSYDGALVDSLEMEK